MSAAPKISVALLTYNGGELLKRALDAITSQDYAGDVELVAIDSGSTDGTVELLRENGAKLTEIPNAEFNFGATRDRLYTKCSGEYVVNLSQDAIPAHDQWLTNLVAPLIADSTCAVSCGASIPDPDRGFRQFPWERNGYFYFTREIKKFVKHYGNGISFANSAVRRSVWEEFRFDPIPLGEDFQFQIKLEEAGGYTRAYPKGAEVLHHHNYTLRTLYARAYNEGLALNQMGCPYSVWDMLYDIAHPASDIQWLRELVRGDLRSGADLLFPAARPWAVWRGSRGN